MLKFGMFVDCKAEIFFACICGFKADIHVYAYLDQFWSYDQCFSVEAFCDRLYVS